MIRHILHLLLALLLSIALLCWALSLPARRGFWLFGWLFQPPGKS